MKNFKESLAWREAVELAMNKLSGCKTNEPSSHRANELKKGFTLIELLVTLALVAVTSFAGFLSLGGYKSSQDLKLAGEELIAVLQDTRKRSVTQENGQAWGIRFANTVSSSQYTVFQGSSYDTGSLNRLYSLRRGVKFSEPVSSSTADVSFAPATGLAQNKIISLVDGSKSGRVNNIIINTLGRITSRLETNVAGYWHFDENVSSTVYDASGTGNDGSLYSGSTVCASPPSAGCPAWQSASNCKAGFCLSLDGADDYVNLPILNSVDAVTPDAKTTVEFWMYWNGTANKMPFGFTSYDLYFIGGGFGFNTANSDLYGIASAGLANRWVHVAAVFGNGAVTQNSLYIDGVSQTLTQRAGAPIGRNIANSARIGGWNNDINYNFGGKIDEVRIYNRALSAAEILNHYNDIK